MAFETEGFLNPDIAEVEKTIAARYPQKWQMLSDTNRLTHRIIYSIKPRNDQVSDLLLAALLIRQASAFQAFCIILGRGLLTQAQILLRNLAEMMFITGAIGKDGQFVGQFVLAEELSRLKSLRAIADDLRGRGEVVDAETTALIESLDEKFRKQKPRTFTTQEIARIAGLSSYYDTLYRLTSMAVHASPRDLNTAFVVDEQGNVVSVSYEPQITDLDLYLDYGISMMLYALHEIARHFKIDVIAEIEQLQRTIQEHAGPASQAAHQR